MEWNKIKTEYVTTDTSYRKLSLKYKITSTQIANHSKAEGWVAQRKQYLQKTYAKTLTALAGAQARRVSRIMTITDKILDKLEKTVEQMPDGDFVAYRQLTSALKDIKEIQMLKSDADMREQEARIANLKRQAQPDGEAGAVNVVMSENAQDYAK
jgi:hypothetical protein